MITIYAVAYNEEVFLQFMIDHYRNRFPNCHIVVYDNQSSDRTVEIAKANGCDVIEFNTNNQISDRKYLEIKNSCWKSAQTDWVLVCDVDELLNINQEQLLEEESWGVTIILSEAYNLINMEDNFDFANIKYGSRCSPYDKSYLFKRSVIQEINYTPGCHVCNPVGSVTYSDKPYLLYHYKCLNPDFHVDRYKEYTKRLSDENRRNGWGSHYNQSESDIRNGYIVWRAGAELIIKE